MSNEPATTPQTAPQAPEPNVAPPAVDAADKPGQTSRPAASPVSPITDYLAAVRQRIPAEDWEPFVKAITLGSRLAHERLAGKAAATTEWAAMIGQVRPALREEIVGLVSSLVERTVAERTAWLRA